MEKLDFKRKFKFYYRASAQPTLVTLDDLAHITLEGQGEPGGKLFSQRTQMLISVAYAIKKLYKLNKNDFAVPPLEAMWWVDGNIPVENVPRSKWNWKLMIRMPEPVPQSKLQLALNEVHVKKKIAKEELKGIRLQQWSQGSAVQVMHIGSYSSEEPAINSIFLYAKENGLVCHGPHHEIYLSDPRKTPPEKLKTIIRYSVKKK